jgi:hypothetical protein
MDAETTATAAGAGVGGLGVFGFLSVLFNSMRKQITGLQGELEMERKSCTERIEEIDERHAREIKRMDDRVDDLERRVRRISPQPFPAVEPDTKRTR